ncbi:MAG: LptF/LptG family permease [Bacteroidota bacterium]
MKNIPGFTTIDRYIIRKFLTTFFFALILFLIIAIVFDITEKLDDFIDGKVPLSEIVFTYYFNFVPYFAILFTPLFLFVSVIFFTSRMAANSEIVAILNSGMTFRRMLVPFFIAASFIMLLNIYANHWVVPEANKKRVGFENTYINTSWSVYESNLHMQIDKGLFMYLQNYNFSDSTGYRFAIEKFTGDNLVYKLRADRVVWNYPTRKWKVLNYTERRNGRMTESLHQGKDTLVAYNFSPKDFARKVDEASTLNATELNDVIADERMRGSENVPSFEVEKYKRTAFPFAILVLTLIAVSLSSKKTRGGTGLNIGLGIALSFSYILFQQFAFTFSINGNLPAIIAVWIPNVLYLMIALVLLRLAPK